MYEIFFPFTLCIVLYISRNVPKKESGMATEKRRRNRNSTFTIKQKKILCVARAIHDGFSLFPLFLLFTIVSSPKKRRNKINGWNLMYMDWVSWYFKINVHIFILLFIKFEQSRREKKVKKNWWNGMVISSIRILCSPTSFTSTHYPIPIQ